MTSFPVPGGGVAPPVEVAEKRRVTVNKDIASLCLIMLGLLSLVMGVSFTFSIWIGLMVGGALVFLLGIAAAVADNSESRPQMVLVPGGKR